ncbi:methylated-DNA--cysteine S-met [Hypoxylon sp. FL1284]|nr:methylated-DNA--cysteine S-met [Hypoxylon sp. FL1284]
MTVGLKRKHPDEATSTATPRPRKSSKSASTRSSQTPSSSSFPKTATVPEDMAPQLRRIASSGRTAFEKQVWALLCQIPRGSTSTYGLMAARLGSSPRAVGNALRRNPFAPQVPCHRVVATGGTLGGFKGVSLRRDGEGVTLDEKRRLLRAEGVRIDAAGRVLGTPWAAFGPVDLETETEMK